MGSSWLSFLITSTIYLSIFIFTFLHLPTINVDEVSEYADSTVVTLVKAKDNGKNLVNKEFKLASSNIVSKPKSETKKEIKRVKKKVDDGSCCSTLDKDKPKKVSIKKESNQLIKKQFEPKLKKIEKDTTKHHIKKRPTKEKPTPPKSNSIVSKESIKSVAKRGGKKRVNRFFKELKKEIAKNKLYPKRAKRRGVQGRVKISFTIEQNGSISNIALKGKKVFFKSAKRAILKSQPINTKDIPINLPINISLTLSYRLK